MERCTNCDELFASMNPSDMMYMMEQIGAIRPIWSCSHCGPSLDHSTTWCALGCGRDFNQMDPIGWSLTYHNLESELIDTLIGTLLTKLKAAEAVCEALETNELAAIRHLVNSTSLPLDLQPARERWLRKLTALADALAMWHAIQTQCIPNNTGTLDNPPSISEANYNHG